MAGRVALVSGGGSGIGKATSVRLAQEGATVVVCDLDSDRAGAVAGGLGGDSIAVVLDATELEAWERGVATTLEYFGRLDALVNCAGVLREEPIDQVTPEGWNLTLAVNLDGTLYGCLSAVDAMRRSGGGAIVNVASVSAVRADDTFPAYCTSKGAVLALTEEIAAQCARRGHRIRCNAILPATIRTSMTVDVVAAPGGGAPRAGGGPSRRRSRRWRCSYVPRTPSR